MNPDHVNIFTPGRKSLLYILPGAPVPLARPRLAKGVIFDSQKNLKLIHALQLSDQHEDYGVGYFEGPLDLEITFYFTINKRSTSARLNKLHGTYKISKPDLSNLIKFYEDIGTGILYKDDSLICSIYAQKLYDDGDPRTELIVTERTL